MKKTKSTQAAKEPGKVYDGGILAVTPPRVVGFIAMGVEQAAGAAAGLESGSVVPTTEAYVGMGATREDAVADLQLNVSGEIYPGSVRVIELA